jgi:hypothetical protein
MCFLFLEFVSTRVPSSLASVVHFVLCLREGMTQRNSENSVRSWLQSSKALAWGGTDIINNSHWTAGGGQLLAWMWEGALWMEKRGREGMQLKEGGLGPLGRVDSASRHCSASPGRLLGSPAQMLSQHLTTVHAPPVVSTGHPHPGAAHGLLWEA